MGNKLLTNIEIPCPFCSRETNQTFDGKYYQIKCKSCGYFKKEELEVFEGVDVVIDGDDKGKIEKVYLIKKVEEVIPDRTSLDEKIDRALRLIEESE